VSRFCERVCSSVGSGQRPRSNAGPKASHPCLLGFGRLRCRGGDWSGHRVCRPSCPSSPALCSTQRDICCRIFTPAQPDCPAASVRDYCSGAYRDSSTSADSHSAHIHGTHVPGGGAVHSINRRHLRNSPRSNTRPKPIELVVQARANDGNRRVEPYVINRISGKRLRTRRYPTRGSSI
jgi:hypothetical protein